MAPPALFGPLPLGHPMGPDQYQSLGRGKTGNLAEQTSETETSQAGGAARAKALGQETLMLSGKCKSFLWGHERGCGEDLLNPSEESEFSPQG